LGGKYRKPNEDWEKDGEKLKAKKAEKNQTSHKSAGAGGKKGGSLNLPVGWGGKSSSPLQKGEKRAAWGSEIRKQSIKKNLFLGWIGALPWLVITPGNGSKAGEVVDHWKQGIR